MNRTQRFREYCNSKRARTQTKSASPTKTWPLYIAITFVVLIYGWLLTNSTFLWPELVVYASNCGFLCLLVLSPLFGIAAFCIHFLYIDRLRSLEFLIVGVNLTWFATLFNIFFATEMLVLFSYATPLLWVLAAGSLIQIITQKQHHHHALAWAIAAHPIAAYSMAGRVLDHLF